MQETQNSQNNLKEKQSWETHSSQFQNLQANYNNQDSVRTHM